MKNKNYLQNLFGKKEQAVPRKKVKTWQALLAVGGLNIVKNLIEPNDSVRNYQKKKLKTPDWNASSNMYALAWGVNNISRTLGAVRLLNKPDYPNRKAILRLQALMWVNYLTFNKVFAGMRSPVLGLVWTESYKLMSWASLSLARQGGDTKIILSQVPGAVWSLYNGSVAYYTALRNKDKVFKTIPKQAGTKIVNMYPGIKRKAA